MRTDKCSTSAQTARSLLISDVDLPVVFTAYHISLFLVALQKHWKLSQLGVLSLLWVLPTAAKAGFAGVLREKEVTSDVALTALQVQ